MTEEIGMRFVGRVSAATAAMAIGLMSAASAQAVTLFYNFGGPTAEMPTDTSFTSTFNANAGPGGLAFELNGFLSLDGQNFFEDDFSVDLNGTQILDATFNLGGGGADVVYSAPVGSWIFNTTFNGPSDITFAGGVVILGLPVNYKQGLNTVTFAYDSLPPPDHAGFQGLGDEGWSLGLISAFGADHAAVPEPLTWSLMIMGFGAAGAILRRARQLTAA
jgi:hypothetical protein